MPRIFLMRHGEALDDVNNTYGGWADDEPTVKGLQDAKKAVVKLKNLQIQLIISSPLKRALKPAQLFSKELNAPLEISEDFKERNTYGFLTGVNKDLAKKEYPELVAKLSDLNFTIKDGELFTHVRERVLHGLKKVVHSGKNTLIVSHGGAIRTILSELDTPRDVNPDDFEVIEITNLVRKSKNLAEIDLQKIVKNVVADARKLKDKYTAEKNAPVNYVCIFSQSETEYQDLLTAVQKLGKIIDNTTMGPIFHIAPISTVAGELQLLKIRLPDAKRPERGDADFTVANYDKFKATYLSKPGFSLIKREKFEMIELANKNFNVLAYFSHPPLTEQFGIK